MNVSDDGQNTASTTAQPKLVSSRFFEGGRAAGFFLATGGALFHAITTLTPLPGWELDPLIAPVPHTGLGPGGSMLVDGVVILGVLAVMVGEWTRGARISLAAIVLLLLGGAAVSISGRADGGEPYIAQSWIAAMALGVAMFHLCRDDRYKRMALAVLAGLVIILAIRGLQQVVIEHPQTMQEYRQNRERFLDAQGWTYDSPMAKSYERRIKQNEATGWFGLANVYATFAAGGATAGIVLVASSLLSYRRRRRENKIKLGDDSLIRDWWHITIPCAGIAALILADAKGGMAAFFLGIAFAGLTGFLLTRQSRLIDRIGRVRVGAILSLGALAATVALVVFRGLLGTRIGELSLLFRWFYLEAAARIGLQNFPLGCGADGFKPMYSLFKNPLSPEEVSSSHNLLADFWACGGLFGVAWIALWLWWIAAAGSQVAMVADTSPPRKRREGEPDAASTSPSHERRKDESDAASTSPPRKRREGEPDASSARAEGSLSNKDQASFDFRVVACVGVVATLVALRLETPIMTPDLALVRVICLIAWCGVAWLMISKQTSADDLLDARAVRFALSAAAVAMGAHALIDQTGVWPSSAPLLMFFIGAAAAGTPADTPDPDPLRKAGQTSALQSDQSPTKHRWAIGAVIVLSFGWVMLLGSVDTWKVFRWERLMIHAAETVHPAAEISIAWQNLNTPRALTIPQTMTERQELREALEELTGHAVKETPDGFQAAVDAVVLDRIQTAIGLMTEALAKRPGHRKTQRELSRLELVAGQRLWVAGDRKNAKEHLDRALAVAVDGLSLDPAAPAPSSRPEATYYGWAAVVHQTRYELTKDTVELRNSIAFLEQGAKLDPYGLEYPKRLMKLHVTLGNTAEAVRWARKALEIDELQRLDKEVQGLRESERAEAQRLTRDP